MRTIALFIMMLLCSAQSFAQGETSNWYFGHRAGIRFNIDGSVTALDDGRLQTFEGCATISDPFGDLLFYTDGITVFDRTHLVMENGRSLYGDASSTQSAIIVPDPGNPDRYYIFTVDTKIFQNDPDFGLNYSVVDMSLNDGNGAVIIKNVNLLNDCSEKITAVIKDCADQSFWVLTLATSDGSSGLLDTFHAFEVNVGGVVATSIKSTFPGLNIEDPRGYLKLSPDGTKVASANASSGLYLYDFDASTGQLSNQTKIEIGGSNKAPYGVEFSPDGQLLYINASNDIQGETGHSSSLLQYDLTATDINGSEFLLDRRSHYRAGLQLGENGKIYHTIANSYTVGTPFLGAINNPNERGDAAGYEYRAVDLGSRNGTQGLPPFVQSFFNKTAIIRNADGTTSNSLELCEGGEFLLQTDDIPGAIYEWQKDGNPISNSTNLYEVLSVDSDDSGRYTVKITTPDPKECPIVGEAFIRVNPLPVITELSLIQCDIDPGASEDGFAQFNLSKSVIDTTLQYQFYESIADRDSDIPIIDTFQYRNTEPFNQTLYYRATNEFGCNNFGILQLEVLSNPFAAESTHILYSCDEDPTDSVLRGSFDLPAFSNQQYSDMEVIFYGTIEDATDQENPLQGILATSNTQIYARLESDNQCLGVDRIDLEVLPSPLLEFESGYILCTDNPQLVLEGPPGFDFYRWEKLNGTIGSLVSETNTANILKTGVYRISAGYLYSFSTDTIRCEQSVEFQVFPSYRASFEEVLIEDFTNSNTVQALVRGDGSYEYSLDGISYQDADIFRDVAPGFYTLHVRDNNGCGISTKEISVLGYPKFFTPNGDGVNDIWKITGANEQFQPNTFITIYDRYGNLLAQFSPLDDGWNGMLKSNPLPASDYWFRLTLSDGREITGHFALKR